MTNSNAAGTMSAPGGALEALRARRGWVIGLGVISLLGGFIALSCVVTATLAAVFVVGAMMIVSGITEIVSAFKVKSWGKSVLWGLLGALYVVAGFIVINNPFVAAKLLTLVLSGAMLASGAMRIYLAFQMKQGTPWVWVAFSGAMTMLLGVVLFAGWPVTGFYALGMLLGIDLIFSGIGWLTMGLSLKKAA